jgi:hypothetical protein
LLIFPLFLRLLGFCSSVLATSPRWLIWFQFSLPRSKLLPLVFVWWLTQPFLV